MGDTVESVISLDGQYLWLGDIFGMGENGDADGDGAEKEDRDRDGWMRSRTRAGAKLRDDGALQSNALFGCTRSYSHDTRPR